jgi:hypothetical protein
LLTLEEELSREQGRADRITHSVRVGYAEQGGSFVLKLARKRKNTDKVLSTDYSG